MVKKDIKSEFKTALKFGAKIEYFAANGEEAIKTFQGSKGLKNLSGHMDYCRQFAYGKNFYLITPKEGIGKVKVTLGEL